MLTYAFGSDDDIATRYAKTVPGSSVERDDAGRPLVKLKSGNTFEVNPEGLDFGDVIRFGSKVAQFFPAAKLAGMAPGLATRIGTNMGLSAATEVAGQRVAGREEINPTEVAFAAGGGGLGEVFAPIAGAIFRDGSKLPRAEAIQRARAAMQGQGLPDDVAAKIGQRLDEINLGGSADDLIGEAEFGFQYTKGQRTGDMRTLMDEERLSQSSTMLEVQRQNADVANRSVRDIARGVAGGEVDSAPGAIGRATDQVRRQHKALKGEVNQAYDRFRGTDATVPDHQAHHLPAQTRKALGDFNVDPINTPGTVRALEILDTTFGNTQVPLSAKTIDQARRQIRTISGANASDKAAKNLVVRQMDQWLDESLEKGLVNGDPNAIQFLKDARKLNTDLAMRYGASGLGKDVDNIVGKMLRNDASADELARMVYGAGQVSAPAATRALARIKMAMVKRPEEWNQLRAQVLRSAATGKGDNALGVQTIHSNLRELMVNRPDLMSSLFTKAEREQVTRLINAMTPILRNVDKRSSGTTERLMRVMAPYVTRMPILRQIFDYAGEAAETAAVRRNLSPLAPKRNAAIPAVGSALGLQLPDYLNQKRKPNGR